MTIADIAYAAQIAMIATPIVIALGFAFAYRQLSASRNARMAQIILSITARWDSQEMEASRRKVNDCGGDLRQCIEKADRDNTEELYELVRVSNFFDALGALVMEGFLDCRIAYNISGEAEEHYYGLYRPIVEDARYGQYFPYFYQLHEVFQQEAARRSQARPRRTA